MWKNEDLLFQKYDSDIFSKETTTKKKQWNPQGTRGLSTEMPLEVSYVGQLLAESCSTLPPQVRGISQGNGEHRSGKRVGSKSHKTLPTMKSGGRIWLCPDKSYHKGRVLVDHLEGEKNIASSHSLTKYPDPWGEATILKVAHFCQEYLLEWVKQWSQRTDGAHLALSKR